jgi:TonB family protein
MTTPQQFGEYLLFRRLTSDGLGETFRAGKIGNQGIERVVLLRLFNGAGIDADSLWRTIADRMGLHRILQNPHIGDGADVGRVGSTPYVAYEYVSGKNLAELLSQARARAFQIPTEHALFIMERITFGLSAAFSTRHRDQRVQHGFLVPETVLLSNEGEVRLIGFESAPGLRNFLKAAPIRESFGPCLAPDVVPGTEPAATDDVFSLGSLLYELLTGNRLAHPEDGNFDPLVDEALLAAEQLPLPPSLRALLKSSLAPKAQRIGDVQQWQQAFGRFIAEAAYSPTTFNLAFFMHTLFGGEIEQETLDIAREKATQVDVAALAQVDEPTPGPSDTVLIPPGTSAAKRSEDVAEPDVSAVPEAAQYGSAQYGAGRRKGGNWKILVPIFILAIAGGLAAAYYWSTGRKPAVDSVSAEADATGAASTAEAGEPTAPGVDDLALESGTDDPSTDAGVPAGASVLDATEEEPGAEFDSVDTSSVEVPPTPDEVEQQINRLVNDRADTLEAKYEEELAALRQQLDEARLAQQAAAEAKAAGPDSPPETSPSSGGTGQVAAAESTPSGSPPAERGAQPPPAREAASDAEANEPERVAPGITQRFEEAPPKQEVAEPAPPTPPALGELVELGPGVVRPRMTRRPQPRYPPAARRLNKQADVQLRLLVDENGDVARIERVGDSFGFGFEEAAEAAARKTEWVAATKLGVRVKMWVDLKISFRP